VVSTKEFEATVKGLLTNDQRAELEFALATNPLAHPVIPGTDGVRKARWGRIGIGKRGGVRVVYFYAVTSEIVLLIAAYAKNTKEDLSSDDKKNIRQFVKIFKESLQE